MKLWSLFRKKKKNVAEAATEDLQAISGKLLEEIERQPVKVEKEKIDIRDSQARVAYLGRLREGIQEAKRQCEDIKFEYGQVTSYLKDIQLLDQAPEEEKEKLYATAHILLELTKERRGLQKKEYKFTDAQRRALENYEDSVQKDIAKLLGYEDFQMKVKNDLRQLESEKNLLLADKKDIVHRQSMLKTVGKCLTALSIAVGGMLVALAYCFKVDISMAFVVTVGVAFVLAVIILSEARKNRIDMVITEKKCNRAIFLSNRVKIKYVNNVRTLDYMYHKYQVRNATELDYIYSQYIRAKREWERQRENSVRIHENNQILLSELRRLGLKDCDIWLGQVLALVEPKEMVEVRHDLNVRRQKLREQLDYNTEVMEECLEEMEKIRSQKPEYAVEVERVLSGKMNVQTDKGEK